MYDWRILSSDTFIDINSINLTKYDSTYELWQKQYLKDPPQSIKNQYGKNLCLMTKYYIDVKSKKIATVAGIIYDWSCNQAYNNYELPLESLEWDSIPPGSNAAIAYDIINRTYMPPKCIILHPVISVFLSIVIGLILTYILGLFYLIDRENPLLFFTVITYTIHPFIRYALNIGITHLFGHSFWRRLIFSTLVYKIIWAIAMVGNSANMS